MKLSKQLKYLAVGAVFIISIAGCNPLSTVKEQSWAEGSKELSQFIGESNEHNIYAPIQFIDEASWTAYGYSLPTGKWFYHNGEGRFGYGLTTGTKSPQDGWSVKLIANDQTEIEVNRDIRIQLIELGREPVHSETITAQTVHVQSIKGETMLISGSLPDQYNTSYLLSAEIINIHGQIEDTRIAYINVPKPEINASLTLDPYKNGKKDFSMTLTIHNEGPTNLSFGIDYVLEKKVKGTWRVVPINTNFNSIGIMLAPGQSYDQRIELGQLTPGEYRIVKQVRAEGLDLTASMAAPFTVE